MNTQNSWATSLLLATCLALPSMPVWAAPTPKLSPKLPDTDQDSLADSVEEWVKTDPVLADTDGDGIGDGLEVGSDPNQPFNTDGDRRINALDIDDDNDGVPTFVEGAGDSDQDGVADYLDGDTDNDGLADGVEGGLVGSDHDRDGVDDRYDVDKTKGKDKNGDGIDDLTTLPDADGDKIPDARMPPTAFKAPAQPLVLAVAKPEKLPATETVLEVEVAENSSAISMVVKNGSNPEPSALPAGVRDTDGDAIPDELELGVEPSAPVDTDHDGVFDFLDADDDGDSVLTRLEGEADRDGDGRVNYLDTDAGGYFYCATDGRIVPGIRKFKVLPSKQVNMQEDADNGRYRWQAKKPGIYTLQFILPKGMRTLTTHEKGQLYVTPANGTVLNLGWSEDISKPGYLAGFKPNALPVWYSAFSIQADAPIMINHNIPLVGGTCEVLSDAPVR